MFTVYEEKDNSSRKTGVFLSWYIKLTRIEFELIHIEDFEAHKSVWTNNYYVSVVGSKPAS